MTAPTINTAALAPRSFRDIILIVWIAGLVAVIFVLLFLRVPLKWVMGEVQAWLIQVFASVLLLVLGKILGRRIVQTFAAQLSGGSVAAVTIALSVLYIALVILALYGSATGDSNVGKDDPSVKLEQLKVLFTFGPWITALLWPVLSLLLDYLLPSEPAVNPTVQGGQSSN